MCGPSDSQKQLASQESAFSQLLQQNYTANFGRQSQILGSLMTQFTPISEAGPDQQGFGKNELAALNTQATEGTAADYQKAQQSLNTVLGSRGGGNEFLPTGAEGQLRAALASAGANEQSNKELGITEANYGQGRQNWDKANAGLEALAQGYNPNAIAQETTGATQGAYSDATQNAMQATQQFQAIAGGISGLAKSAAGGAMTGYTIASGSQPTAV